MNVDHMGKMLRKHNAPEGNLYVAAVHFHIYVLPGIGNPGKNLIHQFRDFLLVIRLYQIVQGADLKSIQRMICGGGGKD